MPRMHSMGEAVSALFTNLSQERLESAGETCSAWKRILYALDEWKEKRDGEKSYTGENLYYHSKIIDCKNGSLLIEVDHPGWIQLFRMSEKFILRGFKRLMPSLGITSLAYRLQGQPVRAVQGSDAGKQAAVFGKEVISEEKSGGKSAEKNAEGGAIPQVSELPPELQEIFKKIYQSILTQEQKA